jgi:hypothetical protein
MYIYIRVASSVEARSGRVLMDRESRRAVDQERIIGNAQGGGDDDDDDDDDNDDARSVLENGTKEIFCCHKHLEGVASCGFAVDDVVRQDIRTDRPRG